MMEIVVKDFELESPEFHRLLKLFAKAQDMALMLWDYDQELRAKIKYSEQTELQPARDLLYEYMKNFNIDLDDLL